MASRVGKYLLFETLGEGAFGKVKLGVHEESGEQVAVKIMDKSDIKAQEMTMNVRREIAIMKALKHRNIVNLRQVLTSQSKLYIVMDLVTGGELFTKILNEGKLEEIIARRYFQQLVDGIEYCHRRGVCHRDLKPENLLIDETTGELKITDFGLSAMKGASTTEELLHTQCGSPNYCAPEIIARHKQGYSGNKVDAWSCGIILFALLAGFLPFYDENTKVLYRMIQRDDVKFPKKFPPDAKDLVLRLLHKEPEKRYTLSEVKKHPWFSINYDGDDALQKSIGASPPASRRRRRGHSRKSSVDQAPRSTRETVTRRKSGRSDHDNASHSGPISLPAVPMPVGRAPPSPPPPAVADGGHRSLPISHRPPAPPSVSPPQPRSPLPPPPRPNIPFTIPIAVSSSAQQPPLPPLPPPTVPAPPPPSYASSTAARLVPLYKSPGAPRRTSRDFRDTQGNEKLPISNGASGHHGSANNTFAGGTAPPYSSPESPPVSHLPPLPSFPAPEVRAESMGSFSPPALNPAEKYAPFPNGVPPPPPSFPSFSVPGAAHPNVSYSKPTINNVGGADHQGSLQEDSSVPQFPTVVASASGSGSTTAVRSVAPVEDSKSAASPPPQSNGRAKWTVAGPTPPPSYAQSTMVPVKTPLEVSSGDASWLRKAKNISQGKTEPTRTVKFETKPEVEQEEPDDSKEDSTKPVSLVAQRRLLYSKMESESEVPSPFPENSFRGAILSRDSSSSSRGEPKSAPLPRFADRLETSARTGYPTAKDDTETDYGSLPQQSGMRDSARQDGSSVDQSQSSPPQPKSDFFVNYDNGNGHACSVETSTPITELGSEHDEDVCANPEVEHEGNTSETVLRGSDGVLASDEVVLAPLKELLAAALARYRRIFKLGNSIGITSSPSFSSNKGSHFHEGSVEDDRKPPSSHAEFFARAKAITGAWGIILTQELEEDSDSEEEIVQVTENELQAFSKLLDFWDNRRVSATIPQSGEAILDDDAASPLSEEDILSIQSLLQKLEPKQVEEEMTEVAKEGEDLMIQEPSNSPLPIASGQVDSFEDLAVDDIQIVRTDGLGVRSSQGSAPSDFSSSVHSYGGSSAHTGRSNTGTQLPTYVPMPSSPPPPPPMPVLGIRRPVNGAPAPPPPPMPQRPPSGPVASWDRGAPSSAAPPPPPPPPPPPRAPAVAQDSVTPVPPPPPSPYSAAATPPTDSVNRRMVVTQSTVRDPFRPRAPPTYPPPQSRGNGVLIGIDGKDVSESNVVLETTAAMLKGARIPQRLSKEAELGVAAKRKSSTTASDKDAEARKTLSHDSGRRHNSVASAASDGSGGGAGPKRGHMRSPSRDEHATRGMFTFNMFSRRKSSSLTTFDSELAPDRCLLEIGRILTGMGCLVLMKRGETKMKCEAPVKQEKLLISITCTQEKKVSTIQFKKGRKDKSQIDAKEFYDFFHKVQSCFHDRVAAEVRVQL